jgi:taurine dioxygenase
MATHPTIRPLGDALGGEVSGLNLSRTLDDATLAWIEAAFDTHQVLVFRDQTLDAPALAAFGRRFGTPWPHALERYRHPGHDDVSYIRNVDDAGNIDPFGQVRATTWHADATYEASLPRLAILHALEIPSSGGGTWFANMCAAYDGLPEETRQRLGSLVGLHGYATGPAGSYYEGQLNTHQDYPEQRRPAVMQHPRTDRPILFVNPMHVHGFEGMDQADALELVEALAAHSVQDRFTYHHPWQAGDVVMWDECATMHRGAGDSAPGERRVLLRTIVYPD